MESKQRVLSHLAEEERKIEERANAATEGPWIQSYFQPLYVTREDTREVASVAQFNDDGSVDILFAKDRSQAGANVRFIASARTDIPTLLSTINALRERVEAAEGWVACEERLPEIGQWVQLYCEAGHVTAWRIGRPIPWEHCNAKVTHWKTMSVPPSPKAEEQSNGK